MKKRIAFSIALLMILCLALAGCAQRDNPEFGELDSDVEPVGDDVKPGGDFSVAGGEYFVGMNSANEFSYNINGVELSIQTKIDDYIDGDYFYLTTLAYDLGWHVREPNDPEDPNIMCFWNDPE